MRKARFERKLGVAGSSSVTFVVESLDEQLAVLKANGLPVGTMYTTPSFAAATVSDPAGNLVAFVEQLGAES